MALQGCGALLRHGSTVYAHVWGSRLQVSVLERKTDLNGYYCVQIQSVTPATIMEYVYRYCISFVLQRGILTPRRSDRLQYKRCAVAFLKLRLLFWSQASHDWNVSLTGKKTKKHTTADRVLFCWCVFVNLQLCFWCLLCSVCSVLFTQTSISCLFYPFGSIRQISIIWCFHWERRGVLTLVDQLINANELVIDCSVLKALNSSPYAFLRFTSITSDWRHKHWVLFFDW